MKRERNAVLVWAALLVGLFTLAADAAAIILTKNAFLSGALNPLVLLVLVIAAAALAMRAFPFAGAKVALIALLVICPLWLAFSLVFSASPPVHYIMSCSMLPRYAMGDALLVLPIAPDVDAVGVTGGLDGKEPWIVAHGNATTILNESVSVYCDGRADEMCADFFQSPRSFSESNGPVTYRYAACTRSSSPPDSQLPCVASATAGGRTFPADGSAGALVIFTVRPEGYDEPVQIMHRAIFAIRDGNGALYYFTKGDNNPVFDSQSRNFYNGNAAAVPASKIDGSVVSMIPFLGDSIRWIYNVPPCEDGILAKA